MGDMIDLFKAMKDARAYLKAQGFTKEQARLYRHDGQVLVELLKNWKNDR
jgi:hypothetical protein